MSLRFPTTLEGAVPRNRLGLVTDQTSLSSPSKAKAQHNSTATTSSSAVEDQTQSKSLLSSSYSSTQLKKKRVFSPDFTPPAVAEAQGRLTAAVDTLSGHRQTPSSKCSSVPRRDNIMSNPTIEGQPVSSAQIFDESSTIISNENDDDNTGEDVTIPTNVVSQPQLTIEELIEESRARIGTTSFHHHSLHKVDERATQIEQDSYHGRQVITSRYVKGYRGANSSSSTIPATHHQPQKLDPIGVAKLQNKSRPKQDKRQFQAIPANIDDDPHSHDEMSPQSSSSCRQTFGGCGSVNPLPLHQPPTSTTGTSTFTSNKKSSLKSTSRKSIGSGVLSPSFIDELSNNNTNNTLISPSSLGPLQLQQQLKEVQGQLAVSQARVTSLEDHQVKIADQLVSAKRELDRRDDAIEDRNREIEESVHIRIALLGRIERLEKTIYELEVQAAEPEKRNRELVRINLDLTDKANHFKNALEDTDAMLRTARARVVQLEEEAQLRQLDALQSVSRSEVVAWKAREVELLDANSRIQSLLVRTQGQLDAAVFRVQKSREIRRGGDAAGGSSTPRPQWGLFGEAFPDAASTVQRVRLAYDVINNYAEETKTLRGQLQKYQQMYVPATLPQFAGSSDFSVMKGAALSSFNREGMARAQHLGSEWLMLNRYLPKLGNGAIVPQFLRGTGRATNMFLSESDVVGYCKLAWLELDVSRPPISFDEAVQRMVKKYAPTSTHQQQRRKSSPRASPGEPSINVSSNAAGTSSSSSSPITRGDFAYSFWYGVHWYGGTQPVVALTRDLVYGSIQEAVITDLLFDVKKIRNALTTAARKSIALNLQQNGSGLGSKSTTPAQTPQGANLTKPFSSPASTPVKGSALVDKMLGPGGEDDGTLLALEAAGTSQSLYVPVSEAISILEAQFPLKSPHDIKELTEAIRDIAAGKQTSSKSRQKRKNGNGSSSDEDGSGEDGGSSDSDRTSNNSLEGSSAGFNTPSSSTFAQIPGRYSTISKKRRKSQGGGGSSPNVVATLLQEHNRNVGGVSLKKLFSFNSTKRTHSAFVERLHSQYLYTRKMLLYLYVEAINAASQQTASEAVAHMRSGKRNSSVIFDQSLNNNNNNNSDQQNNAENGGEGDKNNVDMSSPEVLNVVSYKTHAGKLLPMPSTYEQANGGYLTPRTLSHQLWKRDSGIPAQHMDELIGYLFNTKVENFQPISQESSNVAASAASGGSSSPLAGGGGLSHHQGLPGDTLVRVYKCTDVYADYSSVLGRVFSRPLYRFTLSPSEQQK